MAVDAALLENPSMFRNPTMRVYRWAPPCISIGFHQSIQLLDLVRCRAEGVDVVRRPTGGRAVLHAQEIAYAVIIPEKSDLFAESRHLVYGRIGEGLAAALNAIGVPAEWVKRSSEKAIPSESGLSASCFSSTARYELVVGGRKIAGSAQRIKPEGLLQHGSILIGDSHLGICRFLKGSAAGNKESMDRLREKTTTVREHLDPSVPDSAISRALRKGMESVFCAHFEDTEPTDEERSLAYSLRLQFLVQPGEALP